MKEKTTRENEVNLLSNVDIQIYIGFKFFLLGNRANNKFLLEKIV